MYASCRFIRDPHTLGVQNGIQGTAMRGDARKGWAMTDEKPDQQRLRRLFFVSLLGAVAALANLVAAAANVHAAMSHRQQLRALQAQVRAIEAARLPQPPSLPAPPQQTPPTARTKE